MRRYLLRTIIVSGAALLASGCDPDDPKDTKPKACPETVGTICTYIGTGHAGFDGDHMPLHESRLYWPVDITFNSHGTFVLDWNNHRVRKVTADGTLETCFGSDFVGDGDPTQGDLVKPGVDALTIDLNHPTQLEEMPDGNLLLVAWHNHKLRVLDPETKLAYVLLGRGAGYAGDGMPINGDTRVNQPASVRYDKDGNLYILDQRNERIRRIKADLSLIETMVGTGEKGFGGDDGDPLLAKVAFPKTSNPPPGGGMAFDAQGRLYFSDIENHRIRRVDFIENKITTIYGDGTTDKLNNPRDVELGPDGRLYVADEKNNRIVAIDLTSFAGEVVAGTGARGFSGDYGPATDATLAAPTGIDFDANGDLYIADSQNNRVRIVRMGDQ